MRWRSKRHALHSCSCAQNACTGFVRATHAIQYEPTNSSSNMSCLAMLAGTCVVYTLSSVLQPVVPSHKVKFIHLRCGKTRSLARCLACAFTFICLSVRRFGCSRVRGVVFVRGGGVTSKLCSRTSRRVPGPRIERDGSGVVSVLPRDGHDVRDVFVWRCVSWFKVFVTRDTRVRRALKIKNLFSLPHQFAVITCEGADVFVCVFRAVGG